MSTSCCQKVFEYRDSSRTITFNSALETERLQRLSPDARQHEREKHGSLPDTVMNDGSCEMSILKALDLPKKHTAITSCRIPPGPIEPYVPGEDLLSWMNNNFALYGDIYRASIFGSNVYVVSNPVYVERILRSNWQNYPRKGQVVKRIALLLGNGLIASNGQFWKNQRQMIQPAFSKSSVASFRDIFARTNAELLEKWTLAAKRSERVNVTQDVSAIVLRVTLLAIFGEDYDTVAPHFGILVEESARNLEFAGVFRPLRKVIQNIVSRRQRHRIATPDLLSRLMEARCRQQGEPMPDTQLVREIMTLIVAGHETTASLLNWMWYLLSRHPQVQAKLSDEFRRLPWEDVPSIDELAKYSYTQRVIEEALRLYPPLWLMTRKALNDDQLGDFFTPAETEIYISPYLIQRSPHFWEAPDYFDPDRMSSNRRGDRHELSLCPFGAGPRNCIGEAFARVEIQYHLMMVARELRLACQQRGEISAGGMNLLSKNDFIMLPEISGKPVASAPLLMR
jgi:cytochrome P450